MHDTKPTSRAPAILLAGFFAIITGYVLFTDVAHGAPLTTDHAMSLAALVAAIASGHYAWPQLRTGHLVAGALLAVLFMASTAYVVIKSGARNGETMQAKFDRAADVHAARKRELDPMAQAEAMLANAQKRLSDECKTGEGKACKGIKATIAVYEAAIKGHKAALAELGPPVTSTGYTHAARVLAALPGTTATADAIEAQLELIMPFLAVLVGELGTIVFSHMAAARKSNSQAILTSSISAPSFADTAQTSFASFSAPVSLFSGPLPDDTPPTKPRGLPANVVAFPSIAGKHPVIAAIETAGRALSVRELANVMECSEGEASKRWQEVRDQLDVARDGKWRRIGLRA